MKVKLKPFDEITNDPFWAAFMNMSYWIQFGVAVPLFTGLLLYKGYPVEAYTVLGLGAVAFWIINWSGIEKR